MQIRKTYHEVNPELLYAEIKDFALKQGVSLGEAKQETYSLPNDTATFITSSTLIFKIRDDSRNAEKECLRAHIVGNKNSETKLMLDIDEKLFTPEKLAAFQEDLDFIFSAYENKD